MPKSWDFQASLLFLIFSFMLHSFVSHIYICVCVERENFRKRQNAGRLNDWMTRGDLKKERKRKKKKKRGGGGGGGADLSDRIILLNTGGTISEKLDLNVPSPRTRSSQVEQGEGDRGSEG